MRHRILDAAMRIFAAKGYHAASVSNVAREAHVAKGTLYLYFESKDALITAIVDRHFTMITEQVMGRPFCDTLDAFLEELRQVMDVPAEQASFIRVFFEFFGPSFASDEFTQRVAKFFDALGSHYANQILHLQKNGEVVQHHSAPSIGRVLVSMLDGVILHRGLFGISTQRNRGMIKDAVSLLGAGLRLAPLGHDQALDRSAAKA